MSPDVAFPPTADNRRVMNQSEFEADLKREGYDVYYGGLRAGHRKIPTTPMTGTRASW